MLSVNMDNPYMPPLPFFYDLKEVFCFFPFKSAINK